MVLDKAGLIKSFTALADSYEIKGGSDAYFGLSDVKREQASSRPTSNMRLVY